MAGHRERDSASGSRNRQSATLVQRQTRYVTLVKVGDKNTGTVVNALIRHECRLPTPTGTEPQPPKTPLPPATLGVPYAGEKNHFAEVWR